MRRVTFFMLFLACLFLFPLYSPAQISNSGEVSLSGDVMTAEGNQRVDGASVNLTNSAGNPIQQEITNTAGSFRFWGLRPSTYILKVTADGYQPQEMRVDLSYSSGLGVTFYLRAIPKEHTPTSPGPDVSSHELSLPEPARESLASGRKALYAENDPSSALSFFQKALKKAPGCYEAEYETGVAYLKLQQTSDAMNSFRQALKISDGKYGAAEIAIGTLLIDQGQSIEGEKHLRQGIELSPGSWMGFYEIAKLEVRKGNFPEAETSARQACTLAPNVAGIYQLLSFIHLKQENYPALLQDIDIYLQLDSTSPAAGRAKQVRQQVQQRLAQSTPTPDPVPHLHP